MLISIGALILLITLFNFLNLFYTQVLSRIGEITIRKVMGSSRFQIFRFIFSELGISIFFSIVISALILFVSNTEIETLIGFSPTSFYTPVTITLFLLGLMIISLVFTLLLTSQVLSYDTSTGLRGKINTTKLGFNLNKLLLTCLLYTSPSPRDS